MKKFIVGILIVAIIGIGVYSLISQRESEEKLTYKGESDNWKEILTEKGEPVFTISWSDNEEEIILESNNE